MGIRGSNIITGAGIASLTVSFSSGWVGSPPQAGDLAIFFANGFWSPTLPSGWTQFGASSSQWLGFGAYKVLSSGDISTGSLTITFSNTGDGAVGIVAFVGAPTIRENESCSNTIGSLPNTTSGAVLAGETAIYWSTQRFNAVPAIVPTSGSATTLQSGTTANGGSNLAMQIMPGGSIAVASTFLGAFWVATQIIIETPPLTGSLLINPGMDGGMRPQLKGGLNA